jgi:predicted amidophosphoribosyltransferase
MSFIDVIIGKTVNVSNIKSCCSICGKEGDTGDENFCEDCLLEMDLGIINDKKNIK